MRVNVGDGRGFSLIEVLCAMGILLAVSLGVAPLFVLSTRANLDARMQTMAVVLAMQGMERLREAGQSAPTTRVEYLAADGSPLDGSPRPPPLAAYVRRSSSEPWPGGLTDAALLRVRVATVAAEAAATASAEPDRRLAGDVQLVGVRPGRAP